MVAFPDFSLDDHRQAGDASRAIAGSRWDVVVLQQGPSSLPESRQQLLASARAFAAEVRRAGARPAFYSVWPSAPRRGDFPRAIESYAMAARETGGILLPVAAAWQEAWKRDSTLELYSPDGLHPSEAGTYLAALVIHATLTGQSPVGSPARLRLRSGRVIEIGSARAAELQRAADIGTRPSVIGTRLWRRDRDWSPSPESRWPSPDAGRVPSPDGRVPMCYFSFT